VGDHLKFNCLFSYKYGNASTEGLKSALEAVGEDAKFVNHLALGHSIFVKCWLKGKHDGVDDGNCASDFYVSTIFLLKVKRSFLSHALSLI
jgi:hypothetical protein